MPIYEYRCNQCGTEFEELMLSVHSDEAVTCRACESRRVTRLLSAFAVQSAAGDSAALEPGGCGTCGAPRRGMCGE